MDVGKSKFTSDEKRIYDNVLNQDSSLKAKEFTQEGGSLDKLRKIAEKALPNADSATKERIYKNLEEAIQGKNIYYDRKKGKIVPILKELPFIGKLFERPTKTTERFVEDFRKAKIQQAINDNPGLLSSEMKKHYEAQIEQAVNHFKNQKEQLETISRNLDHQDFSSFLENDLFKVDARREKIQYFKEKYDSASGDDKVNFMFRLSLALKDIQNVFDAKTKELEAYKQTLDGKEFSEETSKAVKEELHAIVLQDATIHAFEPQHVLRSISPKSS